MKHWNIFAAKKRLVRVNKEFEMLCQNILDAPSFKWKVGVALDNEFYEMFGMSAEELALQLQNQKTGACIQKQRPTY